MLPNYSVERVQEIRAGSDLIYCDRVLLREVLFQISFQYVLRRAARRLPKSSGRYALRYFHNHSVFRKVISESGAR